MGPMTDLERLEYDVHRWPKEAAARIIAIEKENTSLKIAYGVMSERCVRAEEHIHALENGLREALPHLKGIWPFDTYEKALAALAALAPPAEEPKP